MVIFRVPYFGTFPVLEKVLSIVSVFPVATTSCEGKSIKMDLINNLG
jgi:hypothetical protein